jgi:hypothetical protein
MFIVKIFEMDENMRVKEEKNILLENDTMESVISKVTGEPIIKEVYTNPFTEIFDIPGYIPSKSKHTHPVTYNWPTK